METRELLTPAQRAQYTEITDDLGDRELVRYYKLSPEEIEVVNRHRGKHNRLGFAVQLGYLRFPGRPLGSGEKVPDHVLLYIANQLEIPPFAMKEYAARNTTRREHLDEIRKTFGFRTFTSREYRELYWWLLPIALGTDKGIALVEALVQEMRNRKIIIPAMYAVERLAGRYGAGRKIWSTSN